MKKENATPDEIWNYIANTINGYKNRVNQGRIDLHVKELYTLIQTLIDANKPEN